MPDWVPVVCWVVTAICLSVALAGWHHALETVRDQQNVIEELRFVIDMQRARLHALVGARTEDR